jgi:hypothetical protein
MACICNPSYSEGWDWEDFGSRPAQANSSQDPHPQNNQRNTRTGGVTQLVEYLLCKYEAQSLNFSPTKKKKKKKI